MDIELCRLLYQAYGLSVEEYGAIFQNPDDYAVPSSTSLSSCWSRRTRAW